MGTRHSCKRCIGCGDNDYQGDCQCHALRVKCCFCGLKGHFHPTITTKGSILTPSTVREGSVDTMVSLLVVVVCAHLVPSAQPWLADIRAQVSMAGCSLLSSLGILQHQLQ